MNGSTDPLKTGAIFRLRDLSVLRSPVPKIATPKSLSAQSTLSSTIDFGAPVVPYGIVAPIAVQSSLLSSRKETAQQPSASIVPVTPLTGRYLVSAPKQQTTSPRFPSPNVEPQLKRRKLSITPPPPLSPARPLLPPTKLKTNTLSSNSTHSAVAKKPPTLIKRWTLKFIPSIPEVRFSMVHICAFL